MEIEFDNTEASFNDIRDKLLADANEFAGIHIGDDVPDGTLLTDELAGGILEPKDLDTLEEFRKQYRNRIKTATWRIWGNEPIVNLYYIFGLYALLKLITFDFCLILLLANRKGKVEYLKTTLSRITSPHKTGDWEKIFTRLDNFKKFVDDSGDNTQIIRRNFHLAFTLFIDMAGTLLGGDPALLELRSAFEKYLDNQNVSSDEILGKLNAVSTKLMEFELNQSKENTPPPAAQPAPARNNKKKPHYACPNKLAAEYFGVSQSTIERWRAYGRNPNGKNAAKPPLEFPQGYDVTCEEMKAAAKKYKGA